MQKTAWNRTRHALAHPSETRYGLNNWRNDGEWLIACDGHRLAAERVDFNNGAEKPFCTNIDFEILHDLEYPNWRKVIPTDDPVGGFRVTKEVIDLLKEVLADNRLMGYGRDDTDRIKVSFGCHNVSITLPQHCNGHAEYERKPGGAVKRLGFQSTAGSYREDVPDFAYPLVQNGGTSGASDFLVNARYLLDALESMPMGSWVWIVEGGRIMVLPEGKTPENWDESPMVRLVMCLQN